MGSIYLIRSFNKSRLPLPVRPLTAICLDFIYKNKYACDSVTSLQKVEKILYQLWSIFDKLAKKSAVYAIAVLKVKLLNLSTKKREYQNKNSKGMQTHWLSTHRAIEGVYEDFEALTMVLKLFKEDSEATALGLLKQIGNIKFLSAMYLLHDILPVLSLISKVFQEGDIRLLAISLDGVSIVSPLLFFF